MNTLTRHLTLATMLALSSAMACAQTAGNAVIDTKAPCEKPAYPRASLMNEETGTVTVALMVMPDGAVSDSKIEKSSGFKNLDKAAKTALAACKFKPGKEAAWMKMDYSWKLE